LKKKKVEKTSQTTSKSPLVEQKDVPVKVSPAKAPKKKKQESSSSESETSDSEKN